MADAAPSSPNLLQRFGRFGNLALLVLAILASGFAAEMLINSQAVVGSFERRNTHDLGVIAEILQNRQRDFARVARADFQADHQLVTLRHPELETIHLLYGCDLPWNNSWSRLFPPGRRPDDGDQYRISGEFSPDQKPGSAQAAGSALPTAVNDRITRIAVPVSPTGGRICFSVWVPLEKLVSLASTAPDIPNLLIVAPDGTVLEQFGQEKLPIAKLPPLEATPC